MQVYGIDLSMDKFNVNFIDANEKEKNKEVKNGVISISKFLMYVPKGCILCAEHTGAYGDLLVYLCNQVNIPIALVLGYTIKHSLGMIKGKSDPVDVKRFHGYGERFSDKLVFLVYDQEDIVELKQLYTLWSQLVKARKSLLTSEKGRCHLPMQSLSVHNHRGFVLSELNLKIKAVEEEIEALIKANEELDENYELATGINGVGPVIVTDLLIKTGNFININTARKAAYYAGVYPFPNTSGKMVGNSKTSPFLDKKLKALLYMGAKLVVKHNKEYRLNYQKKKLKGKPHYLIMNNVSNKILRTIYSAVKNKTPYNQEYICLDPRENKINSSSKKVA